MTRHPQKIEADISKLQVELMLALERYWPVGTQIEFLSRRGQKTPTKATVINHIRDGLVQVRLTTTTQRGRNYAIKYVHWSAIVPAKVVQS